MPNTDLLRSLARGERETFDAVCRLYGDRVGAIARRLLGRRLRARMETDDIVQTALLELYRRAEEATFDSEAAFLRWLSVVVERKILHAAKRWRAKRRSMDREVAFDPQAEAADARAETPSRILSRREDSERFLEALETLSPTDRRVVTSRLLLDLPWAAVSKAAGVSEEAAQMRYTRARRRLAAALAPRAE